MTPDRSQSPVELSNSEEDPTAPTTSSKNQIRVKNVSEINSNEAEAVPTASKKRKLPSWMLIGFNGDCKKTRSGATENAQLAEASESSRTISPSANGEADTSDEAVSNGDTMHTDEDKPESSHCSGEATTSNDAGNASTSNDARDAPAADNVVDASPPDDVLTSSASNQSEPSGSTTENASADEPSEPSTNGPSCSSTQKPKPEPTNSDEDSSVTVGQIIPTSPKNIKPAVKVEKEEATSSTTRDSCKFGIRCYRRNPMHRIEEAHPGDKDYRRPDFPAPPDGTPPCPFGDLCYRRNPTHFQSFSHPPSTDFEQNWKNYKLRLRQRKKTAVKTSDAGDDDDDDDYDLDDPFIDDDDLDEDFVPSDSDGFDE